MDLQKIGDWIQAMGGTKWLIAQVLSLIGYTLMVITGYIKKEKKMLRTQDVQLLFIIAMGVLLNAFSGIIINTVQIIKNEIYLRGKLNKYTKACIVGLGIVMTLIFNNGGIAGWLPAVNLFIFTYFLGMGGAIGIKILIFITTCGWGVYDFSIKNYVGFIFDILTIISCIIGIIRLKKDGGSNNGTVIETSK
jgi:hypothetical protein